MFPHQIKHLEVRLKYSAARHIFNSLLGGSSGDETLRLILDILEIHISQNLRRGGGRPIKYLKDERAGENWSKLCNWEGRVSKLYLTFQLLLSPHWLVQVLYQISPVAILMTKSDKKRKYH